MTGPAVVTGESVEAVVASVEPVGAAEEPEETMEPLVAAEEPEEAVEPSVAAEEPEEAVEPSVAAVVVPASAVVVPASAVVESSLMLKAIVAATVRNRTNSWVFIINVFPFTLLSIER